MPAPPDGAAMAESADAGAPMRAQADAGVIEQCFRRRLGDGERRTRRRDGGTPDAAAARSRQRPSDRRTSRARPVSLRAVRRPRARTQALDLTFGWTWATHDLDRGFLLSHVLDPGRYRWCCRRRRGGGWGQRERVDHGELIPSRPPWSLRPTPRRAGELEEPGRARDRRLLHRPSLPPAQAKIDRPSTPGRALLLSRSGARQGSASKSRKRPMKRALALLLVVCWHSPGGGVRPTVASPLHSR